MRKSALTILRGRVTYKSYAMFFSLGVVLLIIGLIPFMHYIYAVFFAPKTSFNGRHLASLITGTVLLTASFISFTLGVVADLISVNRMLLEDILTETKRNRFVTVEYKKEGRHSAD